MHLRGEHTTLREAYEALRLRNEAMLAEIHELSVVNDELRAENDELRTEGANARADYDELRVDNENIRDELAGSQRLLEDALAEAEAAQRTAFCRAPPLPLQSALLPHTERVALPVPHIPHLTSDASAAVQPSGQSTRGSGSARAGGSAPTKNSTLSSTSYQPVSRRTKQGRRADNDSTEQEMPRHKAGVRDTRHQREAAAALALQSYMRRLLVLQHVGQEHARTAAIIRIQATVRGNAARGIAERRRFIT